jgi:ubiquinone/menaquinone biosynthesis C-methylase UbiE
MDNPLHKHGRFFDVWSAFYRRTLLGLELRRIQRMAIELADIKPFERVLDLGCGPGDGTARIAQTGATAIGLDYSEGMIVKARKEPATTGKLTRGDAGRLPFKDASFDKVVCTNSFHHYPDHFAALKEVRRVLKPGGMLVLVDPRADNIFGWVAIDVAEKMVFGLDEVRIFSREAWTRMLHDAGFSSSNVERGRIFMPVEWAEVFVRATA